MRKAFTLVETLVVVAVIAVLAAILFPVLAKGKERARAVSDISALAQLGHAYALYEADNGRYPTTVSQAVSSERIPASLLLSKRDPFPLGEASQLRNDQTSRVSYVGSCDYAPPRGWSGTLPFCAATPEELLQLPGSGPLVFLGPEGYDASTKPGTRNGPARYLRLTYAGGVVSRVSRIYPRGSGEPAPQGPTWVDTPVARFYDETGSPYQTFFGLRHKES